MIVVIFESRQTSRKTAKALAGGSKCYLHCHVNLIYFHSFFIWDLQLSLEWRKTVVHQKVTFQPQAGVAWRRTCCAPISKYFKK